MIEQTIDSFHIGEKMVADQMLSRKISMYSFVMLGEIDE